MKKSIFFLLCICLVTVTCSSPNSSKNPDWLDELIHEYESQPVKNPPLSIWQFTYKGQIVYYVPPYCCDMFGVLFNEEGKSICFPDGGFTGQGDGKCPDFFEERKNKKLIWEDSREYPPRTNKAF